MTKQIILLYLLIFSVAAGQLIKIPVTSQRGPVLLDIILFILVILGSRKLQLRFLPKSFLAFIIFLLICLLSLVLSPLNLTFGEYLNSSLYILRLSIFLLFGVMVLNKTLSLGFEKIIIVSGLILSVLGLLQFLLIPDMIFLTKFGWDPHFFRTVSTVLDPNFLGIYLTLSIITLFLAVFPKKYTHLKIILFAVIYTALITTFSRSSALLLFVSLLTISILKKSFRIFLLAIFLTAILVASFYTYISLVAIPRNIDREASAKLRLSSWNQGLMLFSKSPVLGIGFNNYQQALKEYSITPSSQLTSRGGSSNDSSLLFVLATTGLLGLTVYLTFIVFIIKECIDLLKTQSEKSILLIAGILGLVVNSFFINSLFYPFTVFWIFLLLGSLRD